MRLQIFPRLALSAWLVLAGAAPLLAQDAPTFLLEAGGRAALPVGFRTSADPLPQTPDAPSGLGLAELNASASAQFSQAELRQMRRHLPYSLMVVDLRAQPHGFINGLAVSWQAEPPSQAMADLPDWLEAQEAERLQAAQEAGKALMSAPAPAGGSSPPPLTVDVHSAQTEAQLLALSGLGYARLPLNSPGPPSDGQVEGFLALLQGLPPGAWVHWHGGADDDRPALALLLHDILANAPALPLDQLVARQALLSGGLSLLPQTSAQGPEPASGSLAGFLLRFHAFAAQAPTGQAGSWSAWQGRQALPPSSPAPGAEPSDTPREPSPPAAQ